MDNNEQLATISTPAETQGQLYILNSPIDCSEQQLYVYQYPGVLNGESGAYCVVYKRDHFIVSNPPNYRSPTKRSFLNACIRQLYLINGLGHKLYWPANSNLTDRAYIWRQVDNCLLPERLTALGHSLLRVKRQLFRETQRKRKNVPPIRGKVWGTQVFHFKPMRQKLGRRYIRRNYMIKARSIVVELMIRENLRREIIYKPVSCNTVVCPSEGIYNVNAKVINDICNYHHHKARHQRAVESRLNVTELRLRNNESVRLTQRAKRLESMFLHEQVRRAVQKHQLILEESVRSVFYAKELFRLIEDHEEFVYTDNSILERARP